MIRVKYIGKPNDLYTPGITALGQIIRGQLHIQVDDLRHPHSCGWHPVNDTDWFNIPWPLAEGGEYVQER